MMTLIGCVGNAMVNSGLDEILTAAFGSAEKILNGKTFPIYFSTP